MDLVLQRGVDYGGEFLVKLMEVALRFDLDMYDKSRILETLLVYQCEYYFSCIPRLFLGAPQWIFIDQQFIQRP